MQVLHLVAHINSALQLHMWPLVVPSLGFWNCIDTHYFATHVLYEYGLVVHSVYRFVSHNSQVLLDLARGLFEETSSLEAMMTQVMREAQHLIPCEHCTIIVLDQENQEVGWERM